MRYASNTGVSCERSRNEIESILGRYGATSFLYGTQESHAVVMFEMCERRIKFVLQLPSRNAKEFHHTPAGRRTRSDSYAYRAWEQACRQRWRALALVIKAKLEAVESKITMFEEEFLAHIVLPDGRTMGEFVVPQIAVAYESKRMPLMLPFQGAKQ